MKQNSFVSFTPPADFNRSYVADDSILVANQCSTASTKMLANFVPPFGATVIDKLSAAGFTLCGKTAVPELSVSVSTDTALTGPCLHHQDPSRSSAGAATGVATGQIKYALAADVNGSARRFAAFSGVHFVKPTYGTVSRFGLVANMSSGEQIGVMTAKAADMPSLLSVIAGNDPKDGTSLPSESYAYDITLPVKGMKIGLVTELFDMADEQTKAAIQGFLAVATELGAAVTSVSLPLCQAAGTAVNVLSSAEACNNFSRFDGVKYGYRTEKYKNLEELYTGSRSEAFGLEVKQAILMGSHVLSKEVYGRYYEKALRLRGAVKAALHTLFADYDILVAPVSASVAYPVGTSCGKTTFTEKTFTALATISGVPAVVAPCKTTGLPVGVQLLANSFEESKLFSLAHAYEEVR